MTGPAFAEKDTHNDTTTLKNHLIETPMAPLQN
ncbi:hypothetical protein MIT1002_01707 [Alteromonas macleodii]|nr:hypothetical protein MIT1002_01707 [Alteromonas macleodii]VTP52036.1 hypothetical protein MIT1002_01707 [Alteromonas macleodii]